MADKKVKESFQGFNFYNEEDHITPILIIVVLVVLYFGYHYFNKN
jgi:hypothetical protein